MRSTTITIVVLIMVFTATAAGAQEEPLWVTCFPNEQLPRPADDTHETVVPEAWRSKHVGWNLDVNRNFIEDSLEQLNPSASVDVTVALNRAVAAQELQWLARFGTIRYVARYVPAVFVTAVRAADLAEIAAHPTVAHVEKKRTYVWMTNTSIQNIRVQPSSVYPGATFVDACPGVDGTGVNIAIIDSGVDNPGGPGLTHAALPAAAFAYNAVTDVITDPDDDVGHGTHVAHIALGRPNIGFRGVAPGAGLIDMKVGGPSGPDDAAIARAVDKCIEKKTDWNCRVMNLSLGDCSIASDGTLALDMQLNAAVAAGISVVVANGNAGGGCPPSGTVRIGSPAAADKAITVQLSSYQGSVTRTDDAIGSPVYLRGPRVSDLDADTRDELKPDVSAPGMATVSPFSGMLSARWDTAGLASSDYFRAAGTSMASPHVAGFAALLLQANPGLTADEVKQLILASAENRSTAGWVSDWGSGLIDGMAACQLLNAPKTNLKFDQHCNSAGSLSWTSPDVYAGNPIITEGVANTLNAVIVNAGPNAASGFQVELGVHDTSNSTAPYSTVCVINVPFLAAGATTTVSCAWTPVVALTTGTAHACLKAKLVYFGDNNAAADCAQRNVQIVATQSPAVFRFTVVNPTREDLTIDFRSDLNLCNADGWELKLPAPLTLRAGEPPRVTEVLLDPRESSGAKIVAVETVGTARDGRRFTLGGVTLVAQTPRITDCNRNGVDDAAEIQLRITPDRNGNKVPDDCENTTPARRRSVR